MYKFLLIICFITGFAFFAKAQKPDSLDQRTSTDKKLQAKRDSVKANPIVPKVKEKVYHPDSNHSVHKAVMRSLMIPGWGQIYNHQIWAVPIIYTGLGLLVSVYVFNQQNYAINLKIAQDRERGRIPISTDKEYTLYQQYDAYHVQTADIDNAVAGYKRDEELGVFGFVGAWGIQIIQAYIQAKFQHSYTMDNNLALKVTPIIMNPPTMYAGNLNTSYFSGIKLTFTLR